MRTTTIKLEKFNPEFVTFTNVRENKKKMKNVYLGYNDTKNNKNSGTILCLETPRVFCPFGSSTFPHDAQPEPNLKYNLNFNLNNDDKVLSEFKTKLDRVKERLVEHLLSLLKDSDQRKMILTAFKIGKKDQKDTEKIKSLIENNIRSLYKESTDEKYSDYTKVKINNYNNNLLQNLSVYQDMETLEEEKERKETNKTLKRSQRVKKPLEKVTDLTYHNIKEVITRGNHILVFRVNPVYFISGSSGIPFSLQHIVLECKNSSGSQPSFLEEEEEDEQKTEETVEKDTVSDDEENLSEEEDDEDLSEED